MTLHTFTTELWLPVPRVQVFSFFANARNLEAITPPWLSFKILNPETVQMRPGALIDYRLRVRCVPIQWQTEITVWEPSVRFVDEQRRGPYRRWVHTHTFTEQDCGTLCHDHVEYAVPGGRVVDRLFVRREVEKIFAFRAEAMSRRYSPGG
jgi:ligand-binding SRPBCC domain-containing protein